MQFLLIMGIGTLVAIWLVANLPKPRGRRRWHDEDIIPLERKPAQTSALAKDIAESFSTDEMDCMVKSARHQDDPLHWPPPLPPPPSRKTTYETDCD